MDLSNCKSRVDFRLPVNIIAELDSLSEFYQCKSRTDALCHVIQEMFDAIFYQEVFLKNPCISDYDDVIRSVNASFQPIALGHYCDHALPHKM